MQYAFYFVFIGLAIYGLHRLWQNHPFVLSWPVNIFVGTGLGALISLFRPIDLGYGPMPLWFISGMGGLTALILSIAGRLQLFTKSTLKYSAFSMLSLLHAGISFIVYKKIISGPVEEVALFIQILLISAISLVGFTLPARLIRQREREEPSKENTEEGD